jgi:hypothetical protein
MNMRTLAIGAALVVVAFLVGFIPQSRKASQLQDELAQARTNVTSDELALSIGSVYLQASLKNYGLAGQASSGFFDRARTLSAEAANGSERQKFLQSALSQRDAVTAGLAKGDPAVLDLVRDLFQRALALSGAGSK